MAEKTKSKTQVEEVSLDIEIDVEPPKPLTVGLGGEVYTVRPIKGSLGVALGSRLKGAQDDADKLADGLKHIVEIIFGKKDSPTILQKLSDPDDALDYSHIMNLLNALVAKSTGNPTT